MNIINSYSQDFTNIFISFIFFVILAIFSQLSLNKVKFIKRNISLPKRKSSIDGLRGYLALLVFIHHFVLTFSWANQGYWKAPKELYFQNFGKVGVSIFFIITGYLFIAKMIKNDYRVNVKDLFLSRFFRVFPLYIFATVIVFFIVFHLSGYSIVTSNFDLLVSAIRWFLFHGNEVNGFSDTRRIIAGVDWTLKYEALFYCFLPLIAWFLRINKVFFSFLLSILILYYYVFNVSFLAFNSVYFILFLVGGWVAYYKKHLVEFVPKNIVFDVLTVMFFIFSIFLFETNSFYQILAITFFFSSIVSGNSIFGLLKAEFSLFLGEISYSIYLLHGLVLFLLYKIIKVYGYINVSFTEHLLFSPLIGLVVVALSSLSYIYIEKKWINYGYRLR
ncbi:acyltransferase [Pseudoalteromonas fuliginea]|uniref:acyltransferase family protein n=1 Tax=Pseudoalteromonas fuliginea TaxID=1872678 RepID=UPI003174A0BC